MFFYNFAIINSPHKLKTILRKSFTQNYTFWTNLKFYKFLIKLILRFKTKGKAIFKFN